MKGHKWIILERTVEEFMENGIRWKCFPVIDNELSKTLEIVLDDEKQKHWIVEEI